MLDRLDSRKIGKEAITHYCLAISTIGTNGAIECAELHCRELKPTSTYSFCLYMDPNIDKRISKEAITHNCHY